jgi:hypothetical protein
MPNVDCLQVHADPTMVLYVIPPMEPEWPGIEPEVPLCTVNKLL